MRCPARAQVVNREAESTGLAARLECGSFQHLRGSMFCGALAKCDLAVFGCECKEMTSNRASHGIVVGFTGQP